MHPTEECISITALLIQRLVQAVPGLTTVDSAAWACLWLASPENLQELVNQAECGSPSEVLFRLNNSNVARVIKAWATRTNLPAEDREQTADTGDITQSVVAKDACRARDDARCIITKAGFSVEVAHIYPFTLGKREGTQEQEIFWAALYQFWSKEQVEKWKAAVLGPEGTETCMNLLCLASTAHQLWAKGCWALKPLEVVDDGRVLKAQFFWLPQFKYNYSTPTANPPNFPRDLQSGPRETKLFNCVTEAKICSGDVIQLTTDEPTLRPLPSFDLLEMQWTLHRVLAISGAADASEEDFFPEEEFDSDDDELIGSDFRETSFNFRGRN